MHVLDGPTLGAAVVFAIATSITPGPNNAMLLASGINFGWRRTLPHLLGVSGGLLLVLLLAALGIQQWLFQWPWLEQALQWLGALYLAYLAWRLFNAQARPQDAARPGTRPLTFLGAAAFQWVNPKVWAMVAGYFSTYVPARAGWRETLVLCLMFAVVNLPCVGLWAFAGDRLNDWLRKGHRLRWFNRTMAVLLLLSMVGALGSGQ